jgi:mono/diheme cytochrome c family protein
MMSLKLILSLIAGAAIGAFVLLGQQSTAEQGGRATYQANCSGCHQADLAGRKDADPDVSILIEAKKEFARL